jgi:LacI family transcriptional regulator
MPKAPTIHEVAREAGVSIKTVSRVINNSPGVAEATRAKVAEAVRALDFHPHAWARNLAGRRAHTVAVMIPLAPQHVFSRPFFFQVLYGISAVLEERGYDLLVHTRSHAGSFLEPWKNRRADGLILMSVPVRDPRIAELHREGVPFVLTCRVDQPGSELDKSVSWVDADHVMGAEMAAQHLLGLGHRKIALVGGPENLMVSHLRAEGFWRLIKRAGISPSETPSVAGDFSIEAGRSLGLQLLEGPDRPTAIFCVEDSLAIGVLQAARRLGIRVPEELAVVGYDDVPVSAYVDPPLTTVRQHAERKGTIAASALLRLLERGRREAPEQHVLNTELVVRNSTAPAPNSASTPRGVMHG